MEDEIIERLKKHSALTGRSLEKTVRDILKKAAQPSREEIWKEIDLLRSKTRRVDLDATDIIRQDRDSR